MPSRPREQEIGSCDRVNRDIRGIFCTISAVSADRRIECRAGSAAGVLKLIVVNANTMHNGRTNSPQTAVAAGSGAAVSVAR